VVRHVAVGLQDAGDARGGGRAAGLERSAGSDAVGSSALSLLCLRFGPRTRDLPWTAEERWICLPWPRASEQSSVHSAVCLSAAVLHFILKQVRKWSRQV